MRRYVLERLVALAAIALSILPGSVLAYEVGEIRGESGIIEPDPITLTADKIPPGSNKAGLEFTVPWSYSPIYNGISYCPGTRIENSTIVYKANFNDLSDIGSNWFKLNDYFDVKVEMVIGNGADTGMITVPFQQAGSDADYSCYNDSAALGKVFYTASSGQAIFRLRKSLDGNTSAISSGILEVYGFLTKGHGFGNEPIFRIKIANEVASTPETCTFNNGNPITVAFGSIGSDNLDGNNHTKNFSVPFKCEGGRFDSGEVPIYLTIKQNNATDDYLKTTLSDLNIVIKQQGKIVKPNTAYQVSSTNNSGNWSLTAAPIATANAELGDQEFTAAATVVASFQ